MRLSKPPVHVFAGLVVCACGKKMYVPSNSPKYVCTACRNKIPIVDLEGILLDELKNYVLSPEKLTTYLERANRTLSEKAQLAEALRKELQKVKTEADKTHGLYLAGGLTVPQFKERYQPLDDRKRQIEEELPRIEAEADLIRINEISNEQVVSEVDDLHRRWPKMAVDDRRRLVELLVKDITVGNGEISLNLCYVPSFEEMAIKQHTL
jgi:site-specific DNA recombinase